MNEPPCYLSALGIINALGAGQREVLTNFLAGCQDGMETSDAWVPGRNITVARVRAPLAEIPEEFARYRCRNNQLLLTAYQQIKAEVQQAIECYGKQRVAVLIGSSTSGILEGEQALKHHMIKGGYPEQYDYKQQEIGAPAEFLAVYLGLSNVAYTISTACSSSAKVFASARNLLVMGLCDAVIVGGVDSLCQLTVNGFSALDSVSEQICNPFSRNRDGITIGEGAALFLLNTQSGSVRLCGVGESSDAHHISAPHPEGEGAEVAMRAALKEAELRPDQIDYINLHGTATPKNDEMESQAIYRIFGDKVPCSSSKPLTGHTLGAAGANEVGLCWLLLSVLNREAILPSQVWDGCTDASLAPIDLLTEDRVMGLHGLRRLMSNSFAFGGSNASVIMEG